MYWEDCTIGMTLKIPPVPVEEAEMLAFSKRYDSFPLHHDADYAARSRFGGLIAPGFFSYLLVWSKFMEQQPFGEALIAGKAASIAWSRPVYPGDTLTGRAELTNRIRRNAHNGVVELTFAVCNQHGNSVLSAAVEFLVACRPA